MKTRSAETINREWKHLYNESEDAHNRRTEFLGRKFLELSDMVKDMTKVCEECKLRRGGVDTATRFIDEIYEGIKNENDRLKENLNDN